MRSGQGQRGHHWHGQGERSENAVPMNARGIGVEHESTMKALVLTDHCPGAKLPRNVKVKGTGDGTMCKVIFEWLQDLGYGNITMTSDGEQTILNMVEAIQAVRGLRDNDTVPEQSPKGELDPRCRAQQVESMKHRESCWTDKPLSRSGWSSTWERS